MRKGVTLLFAFLPLLHGRTAIAQPALGFWGGLNRASLKGDAPENASYGTRLGLSAGVVGEFNLTKDVKLSLQPAYFQRGAKIAFEVPDQDEPRDSLQVKLDYYSLPVLLKVVSGNGKTYVTSGLDFGILSHAELSNLNTDEPAQDLKKFFQDVDVAVNFGFGAMLPLGSPLLTLELRYSQSLANLSKSEENPEASALPERFRSSGLQLMAGLLWPLGKN
ncbi:MAG: porin family protein [bacterium]